MIRAILIDTLCVAGILAMVYGALWLPVVLADCDTLTEYCEDGNQ